MTPQSHPIPFVDALLASSRALVAVSARSIADAECVALPQEPDCWSCSTTAARPSPSCRAQLDAAPSTALRMVDRL